MFINNIKNLVCKKFKCKSELGNYLVKSGFPLLGREDDFMIFSDTNKLRDAVKKYTKGEK